MPDLEQTSPKIFWEQHASNVYFQRKHLKLKVSAPSGSIHVAHYSNDHCDLDI